MTRRMTTAPIMGALLSLFFGIAATAAHAQTNILSENYESSTNGTGLPGYAYGDATSTQTVVAGQGTGGSNAGVLKAVFGAPTQGFAGAAIQVQTGANPNTTVTNPALTTLTFDARVTDSPIFPVNIQIQTWGQPSFAGTVKSTSDLPSFTPTATYKTFTYTFSQLTLETGSGAFSPTDPTVQLNFRMLTNDGWATGTHTLQMDNVRMFTSAASVVPEAGSATLLGIAAVAAAGMLARRRSV